ncbi:MAG: helix-turn-helix domain-containing protein [Oscillospiraceae bacterium]|jgi:transcriptional regulator with XRE-family HTH domain|nr:helix-turn-helix domain-containing protein [Oscillospiraceae bacterium]
MPDISDQLGSILKNARKSRKLTRDQLSEKIHISYRYLTAIENENKKPSYDVLFKLIRELGISANEIFYPESQSNETQRDLLILLLNQCGTYELDVATATVKALLKRK